MDRVHPRQHYLKQSSKMATIRGGVKLQELFKFFKRVSFPLSLLLLFAETGFAEILKVGMFLYPTPRNQKKIVFDPIDALAFELSSDPELNIVILPEYGLDNQNGAYGFYSLEESQNVETVLQDMTKERETIIIAGTLREFTAETSSLVTWVVGQGRTILKHLKMSDAGFEQGVAKNFGKTWKSGTIPGVFEWLSSKFGPLRFALEVCMDHSSIFQSLGFADCSSYSFDQKAFDFHILISSAQRFIDAWSVAKTSGFALYCQGGCVDVNEPEGLAFSGHNQTQREMLSRLDGTLFERRGYKFVKFNLRLKKNL